MVNQLQERIKQIILDVLRDYPILIWYDEDASLQDIIFEAIPTNVNFIPFEGSYLAIRARIEKKTQILKKSGLFIFQENLLNRAGLEITNFLAKN